MLLRTQWWRALGYPHTLTRFHFVPPYRGACPSALNELVLEYLAHQGFSATAEVFSDQTGLKTSEDLSSVVHRQRMLPRVPFLNPFRCVPLSVFLE